eukprot:jgi/Psemu1/65084/estExt_Genemark1.C_1010084
MSTPPNDGFTSFPPTRLNPPTTKTQDTINEMQMCCCVLRTEPGPGPGPGPVQGFKLPRRTTDRNEMDDPDDLERPPAGTPLAAADPDGDDNGNDNNDDNDDDDNDDNNNDDLERVLPVVSDDLELLRRGICRVKLPAELDAKFWADELSRIRPMNFCFEGDGEYPLYRNIMEEPEFPFDAILLGGGVSGSGSSSNHDQPSPTEAPPDPVAAVALTRNEISSPGGGGVSEIGRSMLRYFPVVAEAVANDNDNDNESSSVLSPLVREDEEEDRRKLLREELRLDNAFCKHYDSNQWDTTGKLHMDPSDITVNMCLHKSEDAEGSYVLFHGTKRLRNVDVEGATGSGAGGGSNNNDDDEDDSPGTTPGAGGDDRFLVSQEPGYATIHFGDHPHETTRLRRGTRTNVIVTYLYTDSGRSDATTRLVNHVQIMANTVALFFDLKPPEDETKGNSEDVNSPTGSRQLHCLSEDED